MQFKDRRGNVIPLEQIVVPLSIKADSINPKDRTFEGLSATWELDLGNDRIKRGAFKDTIKEWKASDTGLPLLNSHNHWDINAALGQLIDAEETKDGLWSKWEIIEGPDGDAALLRLRPSKITGRSAVGKMSIGYEPLEYSYEEADGGSPWDRIRNLIKIGWKETSLVLFPMNPGASIDSSTVKNMMLAMKTMDPNGLTPDMRKDMRQLASRIGRLLKSTATSASTPTPTPPAPSAPAPTTPTPAPAPTTPPATTPPSTPPTPAPTPSPAPSAPVKTESGDVPIYEYPDALAQRLTKTLVRAKISEVAAPKP